MLQSIYIDYDQIRYVRELFSVNYSNWSFSPAREQIIASRCRHHNFDSLALSFQKIERVNKGKEKMKYITQLF